MLHRSVAALGVAIIVAAWATSPRPQPTASGASAIPTPSGPPQLGIDWTRADPVERPDDFAFASEPPAFNGGSGHPLHNPGQAMMADVVAVPGHGYVSVGYAYPGWHPVAWISPDGLRWSLRPMGTAEFTLPLSMAIGTDRTIVAVGYSKSRPVAWTSTDAGATWSEHGVPTLGDGSVAERMTTVTATTNGYIAGGSVGPELAERHARFWRSADGVTWHPIADDVGAFADSEVRAIASDHGRLVAVGLVGSAQGITGSVAWTSPDGDAWRRIDDPALATGKATALGAAPWGDLIAVGSDLDRRQAVVWTSRDGGEWTKAPDEVSRQGGNGYAWMTDLVAVDEVLLAIGDYQDLQRPTALSWVTRDGQHWAQSRSAPVQQQAEFYAVVRGGSGVIAVGSFGSPDDYIPTVWLSPGR
jgi:hypothetical protein